mgnify:CR=1 FL=1
MLKGNMAKMLKQAQEMQKRIEGSQAELTDTIIDADSGGGNWTLGVLQDGRKKKYKRTCICSRSYRRYSSRKIKFKNAQRCKFFKKSK